MIGSVSNAGASLVQAVRHFDAAAHHVAASSIPVSSSAEGSEVPDLISALVDVKLAEVDVSVQAKLLRTTDDLMGTLLDLLA